MTTIGNHQISERTSAFQGLRVLFILSIIVMHAGAPSFGGGAELCSFFFVISGFLFAGKQVQTLPYMKGKVKKLYPVYLMFLMVQLAVAYYYHGLDSLDKKLVPHLLLLQSFYPRFQPTHYLGPAWFLSSMMFCWLCAPTLSRRLARFSRRKLGFASCGLALLYAAQFTPPLRNLAPDWQWEDWMTYISPVLRLMEFALGLLLGLLIKKTEYKQGLWPLEVLVLITYLLCIYYHPLSNLTTFAHLLFVAYIFSYRSPVINGLLGNRLIQTLAKYSMFFYLGHYPFVKFIKEQEDLNPYTAVAISLVAVTVLTWGYLVGKKAVIATFQAESQN